jgi:hypothetical protein
MRDVITTALDVLGLLLVAAGGALALYPVLGWSCLSVGGAIVLAGSQIAQRAAEPGPGLLDQARLRLAKARLR